MSRDIIQEEIVNGLPSPCHGLLNLAPRVGKTKIAIDLIKKEKPKKILWVTPSTKLRDIDIPREFIKWKAKTYLKKTDIICYASMAKHIGMYNLIILDEYQEITIKNSAPLLDNSILWDNIIGLSGTHPKHQEKLDIYKKLNLKILTSMTIDKAIEKTLIAPYNITVINCELNKVDRYVKAGSKNKPFLQTEAGQYNYFTKSITKLLDVGRTVPKFYYLNRMRFLYDLKSKNNFAKQFLRLLKGRTLVFTGSIKMAEYICKDTYHSKTTDIAYNKFLEGKIDKLSLVNSGGIGSTYRNVDNFLIVQVNSNKKGGATQKIARSLVLQDNYVANIYILVVKDTVDEVWVEKVLETFDKSKVKYINWKDI